MNYFAHGLRFVDQPYVLAGTAIPDWLSVSDRRVRMRENAVMPFRDDSNRMTADLATGILQHLDDDQWFHRTRVFVETCGDLANLFRNLPEMDDGFRPGFLGHIATELLLDGVLIETQPELIDRYYDGMAGVDADFVQATVNQMAKRPATNLARLIPRFLEEQFLRDYVEPSRLLFRLNQVMRRIKLKQLPDSTIDILRSGRDIVQARIDSLLPEEHFATKPTQQGTTP